MQQALFELLRDYHLTCFEKLKTDNVRIELAWVDAQPVAAEALRLEELVNVLHQEGVVDWSAELDVSHVTWALSRCESACHAD